MEKSSQTGFNQLFSPILAMEWLCSPLDMYSNGMALLSASCEARKEKKIVEKLEQYVERMERVF
jgi:hypothetical protein